MKSKQDGEKMIFFREDPFSEELGVHEKQTGRQAKAFLLEQTPFQKDLGIHTKQIKKDLYA